MDPATPHLKTKTPFCSKMDLSARIACAEPEEQCAQASRTSLLFLRGKYAFASYWRIRAISGSIRGKFSRVEPAGIPRALPLASCRCANSSVSASFPPH